MLKLISIYHNSTKNQLKTQIKNQTTVQWVKKNLTT